MDGTLTVDQAMKELTTGKTDPKPVEPERMKIYLFHNFHVHGGYHDMEYLMVTKGNQQAWKYRQLFAPNEWLDLDNTMAQPREADEGLGDNWWAIKGDTKLMLRPLHRTTERKEFGAYPGYETRDQEAYSQTPNNTRLREDAALARPDPSTFCSEPPQTP